MNKKPFVIAGLCGLSVSLGLFMYGGYMVWQRNLPADAAVPVQTSLAPDVRNIPVEIDLPSLNLVLPIMARQIIDGKWQDPGHAVGFWEDSPLPGDLGNSVLYAHNWKNLFGKLYMIRPGDEINIKFLNGEVRSFIIKNTYTVTADETHILAPTDDTRVTLYTCIGFLDLKRFVAIAIPK